MALWVALGVEKYRATVNAPPVAWLVFVNVVQLSALIVLISPLALVAAWRTWVHAARYRSGHGRAWQGVLEAGAAGFVIALFVLAPGIAMQPTKAPPYVVFYGGAALVLGLAIGLVLRTAAILVLKRQARA